MKKPILELVNINKVYSDGFVAVKNFNLTINKGEFVTLLGPSGCGKTTMLKIIGGFTDPTKGKILYNGIDIKDMDVAQRPTSTVFQDYALFPNMTVRQNIEYGLKLMRVPLEELKKDFTSHLNRLYRSSQHLAKKKIAEIEKTKKTLQKEIRKVEAKYRKNAYLNEIMEMRRPEFLATVDSLYNELYEKYGEDYVSKMSLKDRFLAGVNSFLFAFRIPFQFNISSSKMNDIEKQIYKLKKWYHYKKPLDNKLISLTEKYEDLDYDVSYWENYPDLKKEAFEKRNLTRKLTKEEIKERSDNIIKLVGLVGKETSYPADLSGGMQQRVALARSIVIESEILLLDEPLGALDAKVRKQLQNEIKRLHKELKLTFILVTHDQEEALMLSDKIVVMSEGQIEQVGSPNEIYDTPTNLWVANFIGKANVFNTHSLGRNKISFANKILEVPSSRAQTKLLKGDKISVVIRPEDLKIVENNKGFINNLKITDVIYKGLLYEVKCLWNDQIINIESTNKYEVDKVIGLTFNVEDLYILKSEA